MNIIAIGDTHGRHDWQHIVSNTEFDKVVFIGDYFDSHEDISPEQQKINFKEIIKYKKNNMDKVVLLFGNHDYHYLRNVFESYSGFQPVYKIDIAELLHNAIDHDLVQMCLVHENYIFSHAGITKTWLASTGHTSEPLQDFVNDLFKYQPGYFAFNIGLNYSPYGDDICQTPIWVRPQSLYQDQLDDYVQIVGHTQQDEIQIISGKIALIDTIPTSGQFLRINNNQLTIEENQWKK